MPHSHTSLEQWRAFQAVVDHGGFAQAAHALHRSQSAISYAVNRLQEQLGIRLLEMDGRKARLTEMGYVLLDRSRHLVDSATELEELASHLEQGWEAEIRLAVDAAFPMPVLFDALKLFALEAKGTRVTLTEVILSGAEDALREKISSLEQEKAYLSSQMASMERSTADLEDLRDTEEELREEIEYLKNENSSFYG